MAVIKLMFTLYYKIWANAIALERAKKGRETSWKLFSLTSMSILQGINLLALLLLLRLLSGGNSLILFPMHIFNKAGLNTGLSVILTYFVPFTIINYLLVFYNNKYQDIEKVYGSSSKDKLYRNYTIISIGIIAVPLLFKVFFL